MADPGDFLARWSRLKRRAQGEPREMARADTARPKPHEARQQEPAAAVPAAGAPAAQPQIPGEAEALPPIETLGRDSDYTPFMRPDVPDALRNAALRRLWQSDPVFANLDGLVDYAEDFGAAFKVGGVVATVYRVLQGMPGSGPDEPRARAKEGAAAARAAEAPLEPPPSEQPAVAEAAPVTADGRRNEVGLE